MSRQISKPGRVPKRKKRVHTVETQETLHAKAVEKLIAMGGKYPEIARDYYGELYDNPDRASLV